MFCYSRYKSNKYKEEFSWLDNIKEVKEKGLKDCLNEELIRQINIYNFDNVWMAVPEIIEWEKVREFRFKKSKNGYDDIELQEFLNLFSAKKINNAEILKSRKVYAISLEND